MMLGAFVVHAAGRVRSVGPACLHGLFAARVFARLWRSPLASRVRAQTYVLLVRAAGS
jgi:hypothetical protein